MTRDDLPQEQVIPQQVVVEALPKSTVVVAAAFYVVLAGLMGWVLLVAVETSAAVKVMSVRMEFNSRDMDDAKDRADRTDARLDTFERRMYEERPALRTR